MNALIVLIFVGLLVLEACQTFMPASPPSPPQPIVNEEEYIPEYQHSVEKPQEAAPKIRSEREHLELLEGQLDWMKKRIRNEKAEWND